MDQVLAYHPDPASGFDPASEEAGGSPDEDAFQQQRGQQSASVDGVEGSLDRLSFKQGAAEAQIKAGVQYDDKYKTELCKNFRKQGSCPYGEVSADRPPRWTAVPLPRVTAHI